MSPKIFISVSPPAATPPSSVPGGGPCPVEPKLSAGEGSSTLDRPAAELGMGEHAPHRLRARGQPGRLLGPRAPVSTASGAGPAAGHCGKGVEDGPRPGAAGGGVGLG